MGHGATTHCKTGQLESFVHCVEAEVTVNVDALLVPFGVITEREYIVPAWTAEIICEHPCMADPVNKLHCGDKELGTVNVKVVPFEVNFGEATKLLNST